MCFIFCMLWIRSLCNSLIDSSVFRCGSTDAACVLHSCSSSVVLNWKFVSMLLRWAPPSFFIRNNVRVVGDLIQSWYLILCMSSAPPCLASMCCISPLYIVPSLPGSFNAFLSCSLIHLRYAFFSEKASSPNRSCGSCVIIFAVHLGRPHITFWIPIIFLSNFLMVGNEYGTA